MARGYWHDYWAEGGAGDRVIAHGDERKALSSHWRSVFQDRTAGPATIIDIASGDGAAIKFAREHVGPSATLLAFDISPTAVKSAVDRIPGAHGAAADAARLPLANRSADVIVSQFGVEYAGEAAFAEAARVLKRDGVFSCVSHYRGGQIEAECAENERVLNALAQSQVILRARDALAASYAARPRAYADPSAERALRDAAQGLTNELPSAPNLAAKRAVSFFLGELAAMSVRRLAYEPNEALQWLDTHAASFASYAERMRSMRAAALDSRTVLRISEAFAAHGFGSFKAEPMRLDDGPAFAAWRIEARAA